MNISKLETFLTLSKCLNFTEAADKLYCSQPAVSMQIQSLETYLSVPLFDRIGKKLYLTKQGEQFKLYAEQIVNLLHCAKDHLQQMEDLSFGTLSFGASNFVGVYLLPAILGQYKETFPTIKIRMNITSSKQLINSLEANEVEFLILSDQIAIDTSRFLTTKFYEDQLILVAPANHHLVQQVNCSLADLSKETLLLKPLKSATRNFIDATFQKNGISITDHMEISSSEGIKQGVIHGLGISIISKFAVLHELDSGLLVEIPIHDASFQRGVNYIYHKNKQLSPAAKEFIQLLKSKKV